MARYTAFIKKHGKITLLFFGLACILCAVSFGWARKEYGQEFFLPENAQSSAARQVLMEEYGTGLPDLRVMARNISVPGALALKREMEALEEVDRVAWLDDVWNLQEPLEMADSGIVEGWYRDRNACFFVTTAAGKGTEAVRRIRMLIGEEGCMDGAAAERAEAERSLTGSGKDLLLLLPVLFLLLTFATTSFAEAFSGMCTMGAACLLSQGLAVSFGVTSVPVRLAAALLVTGTCGCCVMVFLRVCDENRIRGMEAGDAVEAAFGRLSGVFFSCLFCLAAGIPALFSMEYGAGFQLGMALAAVCLACLACLLCLLPAFAFLTAGLTGRLEHRPLLPTGRLLWRAAIRGRILLLVLAVPVLCVFYLAEGHITCFYGDGEIFSASSRVGQDAIAIQEMFGAPEPVVLLIPRGNPETEAEVDAQLRELSCVTDVISRVGTVGDAIPEEYVDGRILDDFYSAHYCRYDIWLEAGETQQDWTDRVLAVRNVAEACAGDLFRYAGRPVERMELREAAGRDGNGRPLSGVGFSDGRNGTGVRKGEALGLLTILLRFAILVFCLRSPLRSAALLLLSGAMLLPALGLPFLRGERVFYAAYLSAGIVSDGIAVVWPLLLAACGRPDPGAGDSEKRPLETAGICTLPVLISAVMMTAPAFLATWRSAVNGLISETGVLAGAGAWSAAVLTLLLWPGLWSMTGGRKREGRRTGTKPETE